MASRIELDSELRSILGSNYVYFQPPESVKLHYPCIVYELNNKQSIPADNKKYLLNNRYSVILIEYDPDSELCDILLKHFEMCSFDRKYTSDNLYHTSITLFY